MIPSPLKSLSALSLLAVLSACAPTPDFYQAQNLSEKPFNQLDLAGNACGPAALLNSSRFGSTEWRKISTSPPDLTDRERIRSITRGPAMRESSSLPGRARWSLQGINLSDLRDVADEIARPYNLPTIHQETLFLNPIETQQSHLHHVHKHLANSLDKGFPPILSIRRFVKRNGEWIAIQGHFITVTSVPGKIPSNTNQFEITYIDPWGGKLHQGTISIYSKPFLNDDPAKNPNLEAVFPNAIVGKRLVRTGEESILAVSATLSVR